MVREVAADVEAVTVYAKAPAPETVLALVSEEAKKGTPLAKVAELLLYEAKTSALVPWVTKQFAELEAKAHLASDTEDAADEAMAVCLLPTCDRHKPLQLADTFLRQEAGD